ncbi:MAG: shikimate kinase [Lachnospiraceae bacterium]
MERNVILIGYMGAGKTSVGQCLAQCLEKRLVDTDQLIEEKAGMEISRIFAELGEGEFRKLEVEVLNELMDQTETVVISTGGGLPLRPENREHLKRLGEVVYLQVRPETVLKRLQGDTTRPLLRCSCVEERVNQMILERGPIYEQAADQTVSTDGKTPKEIAEEIQQNMTVQDGKAGENK